MAIKASDLRLGNWVSKEGENVKVYAIQQDMISYKNHHYSGISFFEPIPITPDILIKCGFRETENDFFIYLNKHELNTDKIMFSKHYNFIRVEFSGRRPTPGLLKHIKYLHQLMNLFYTLTNTEIEYKP